MLRYSTTSWTSDRRTGVAISAMVCAIAAACAILQTYIGSASERSMPFGAAMQSGWVVRGASAEPANEMVVAWPRADGTVVIQSPRLSLSADLCPTPRLEVSCGASELRSTLAWRRSGDSTPREISKVFRKRVDASGAGAFDVEFDELPLHLAWKGCVEFVAWRIEAGGEPVTLRRVAAEQQPLPTAMWWRQWWSFAPIDAVSINTIRAPHVLGYAPTTLICLVCVFVLSIYLAGVTLWRRTIRLSVAFAVLLIGWLAGDARWIVAQQKQLARDRANNSADVGGLAAAWPAEVWDMAQTARETLPAGAVYAVAGGNLPTAAGDSRLRYLLSPELIQVNLDPLQPRVSPERARYVLVLAPGAAEIDAQSQMLFTTAVPPMHATILKRLKNGTYIAKVSP